MPKQFNWGPALFLIIYHVLLLAILPFLLYYAFSFVGYLGCSVYFTLHHRIEYYSGLS